MSSGKTNPHIDQPTEEQLADLLHGKEPAIAEVYMEAHRLLLELLPDIIYSVDCKDGVIGYGARQYGYDGWGMAAVAPHKKWTSILFLRGADLPDPGGLLEGTGKKMRHAKVRSLEEFEERRGAIRDLIQAAATVNEA